LNSAESQISLRPVAEVDREMVFAWRNDPFILARGSLHREVSWEEHRKWFEETILEHNRRMFIVLHENNPIGQIRFDREGQQNCIVSVYLLQAFTGRGWGVQAIRMGSKLMFQDWNVDRVIACVRVDNPGGRCGFLKAGFEEIELGICPAEHYSLVLSRLR
jgi:UDP-2,4-diacetamido-2,4,6-trideoxy-beta-L-altropyranose hydrolase